LDAKSLTKYLKTLKLRPNLPEFLRKNACCPVNSEAGIDPPALAISESAGLLFFRLGLRPSFFAVVLFSCRGYLATGFYRAFDRAGGGTAQHGLDDLDSGGFNFSSQTGHGLSGRACRTGRRSLFARR
jgi:hypothetical protein